MTDPISRAAMAWLTAVLVLLAAVGGGYWWGDKARNDSWLAKHALAEKKAQQDYEAEVQRGQKKSAELLGQIADTQTSYNQLEESFNELRARGPLLVFRTPVSGVPPGIKAAGTADAALATAPGAAQPSSSASANAAAGLAADAGGAYLTAGTVWLWNSALAGRDTPAGACGAGDTASAACAADTGISFSAALANHTQNAKSCAIDRLRHQALIDFVTQQPDRAAQVDP